MKDNISDVFGIPDRPKQGSIVVYQSEEDTSIRSDANFAKKNIRDLLETGKETLEDLIELAKVSESPRAYEVVATLMRQMADMNSQLLDLYKKESDASIKKDVPGEAPPQGSLTQINNTIFVGTTTELTKALERISNESP